MSHVELIDSDEMDLDCCEVCDAERDDLYDVPTDDGPLIVCGRCKETL